MQHHTITEKVEVPTFTLLDVWHELMADAMGTTKEEAAEILQTSNNQK